jgi:hypothetical protein
MIANQAYEETKTDDREKSKSEAVSMFSLIKPLFKNIEDRLLG